jgi:hypothetical protein
VSDRAVLGPADVSDAELTAMVAQWLGEPPERVELLGAQAEVVPYPLDAITTAGRYRVHGTVRCPRGDVPFRFFVKHVQSWSRSPLFAVVPPEYRDVAEAAVPWYTEALIYRSDLDRRLPAGFSMPRAVAVRDLDEKAAAVWLEEIEHVPGLWSLDRLARAAYLLGRLAASPAVRELAGIGERERRWPVRSYVEGRLALQVLPALHTEEIWRHPLVAGAFDRELRGRLLAAADRVPDHLAELEQMPTGAAHGDACPNNMLVRPDSTELALIDFGFWTEKPLGFDLSQLVVGDVQLGRRPAASLPEIDDAVVPAYLDGLLAEGARLDLAALRRTHALCMLIFSGLSALPLEHLDRRPTPDLAREAQERAALARFVLDVVDATA